MTMLQHGLVPSTGGYQIERSLRFNSADSAYLNRTPASAGNRQKFTISFWLKRSVIGATDVFSGATAGNGFFLSFPSESSGSLSSTLYLFDNGAASGGWQIFSARVFRDVSAWYHFVIALDTTQSTDSNRIKVYINGVQEDISTWQVGSGASRYPSLNANIEWNNTNQHRIGHANNYGYFNGYITEFYNIDGQQLTPSSFGENDTDTGVWKPKKYEGTYGTNGFYLKFADNSGTTSTTLGKDSSGNGNNWTPNNFSVTAGAGNDSLVDTPTSYGTDTGAGGEVRGNYCTANPLDIYPKSGTWTVSNGNLDLSLSGAVWDAIRGTTGVTSGKWYWEITATGINNTNSYAMVGIQKGAGGNWQDPFAYVYYSLNGQKYNNGSGAAYGNSWTTNDVIGVAFDADAGEIKFYKNNTVQNSGTAAYTGLTSGPYTPVIMLNGTGSAATVTCNFGQRPFAYTAPSGFKALCTQNLPTPTIGATSATQAGKYFNTVIWTGNASSPRSITGVGFQPDFVWVKSRSNTYNHDLFDVIRGGSLRLSTNATDAEYNLQTGGYDYISSFNSDGFTATSAGTPLNLNGNNVTFAAWNWKANGAGSSNTQGSITSTVSASTLSGFSIVTYTGNATAGATVGHGLGAAPSMIIVKDRVATSGAREWVVYHSSLGNTQAVFLSTTGAAYTGTNLWNNTSPTSTVFTVGNSSEGTNGSGNAMLAYCFAPIAGYSAFGSYTGNGSSDGTFVYTGFRPKFVMVKNTSATSYWQINDTARNSYNLANLALHPNVTDAEATYSNAVMDILSNGFKLRGNDTYTNTNTNVYIYMAFAEVPTKFSLAR